MTVEVRTRTLCRVVGFVDVPDNIFKSNQTVKFPDAGGYFELEVGRIRCRSTGEEKRVFVIGDRNSDLAYAARIPSFRFP